MEDESEKPEGVLPKGKPEKTFTADDVEEIVRKRLAREKKREPENDTLVSDLRKQLAKQEQTTKALADKAEKSRQKSLRAEVQARLAEAGCLEPELLADSFMARKVIKLDDDDEIVVENAENDLDRLIQDTLASKPHLVRPTSPGTGSKAPRVLETTPNDPSRMNDEQLKTALGFTSNGSTWFKK